MKHKFFVKILYAYTTIGAILLGLSMFFFPDVLQLLLKVPITPDFSSNLSGALLLGYGCIAFGGIFKPEKYLLLFKVQLAYKTIWITSYAIPLLLNQFNIRILILMFIFLSYIAGDIYMIFINKDQKK